MKHLIIFLILFSFFSCTQKESKKELESLNLVLDAYKAQTKEEFLNKLSGDYRLFFEAYAGDGISKNELSSMFDWDYSLNPSRTVLDTIYFDEDSVVIRSTEQNDFSRLMGYPGWISQNHFNIENGKIYRQLYRSLDTAEYQTYLKPALEWLLENDSVALVKVYNLNDSALKEMNAENAKIWKNLLSKWKNKAD
jgi:hypothetical protein